MPTSIHQYPSKYWNINKKLWDKCQKLAKEAMLASGWIERSKKFNEVHKRKTIQLWKKSYSV